MTASVSPIGYQGFTCQQLEAEIARVVYRVDDLTMQQHHKANSDALMVGVSILVFWPAALAIQGNGTMAAELSRHKGELVAMEQMAAAKNCHTDCACEAPSASIGAATGVEPNVEPWSRIRRVWVTIGKYTRCDEGATGPTWRFSQVWRLRSWPLSGLTLTSQPRASCTRFTGRCSDDGPHPPWPRRRDLSVAQGARTSGESDEGRTFGLRAGRQAASGPPEHLLKVDIDRQKMDLVYRSSYWKKPAEPSGAAPPPRTARKP